MGRPAKIANPAIPHNHFELHVLSVLQVVAQYHMKWTHWGLNPGPSACEADVIPLHHVPVAMVTVLVLMLV